MVSDLPPIALLPPEDVLNPTDGAEWTLPDVYDVALAWALMPEAPARRSGPVEHLVGDAPREAEVLVQMGGAVIATVKLRAFVFGYGSADHPWADSDCWALVRLERVLRPIAWGLTPWSEVEAGSVFYVLRAGFDPLSRGSRCFDALPMGLTWSQLDGAWDDGGIYLDV